MKGSKQIGVQPVIQRLPINTRLEHQQHPTQHDQMFVGFDVEVLQELIAERFAHFLLDSSRSMISGTSDSGANGLVRYFVAPARSAADRESGSPRVVSTTTGIS